MADTLANKTIQNTSRKLVVRSRLDSDGTGTTDGILVDRSAFTGPDGTEPGKLVIERIEYQIDGMQVVLEFDADTDDYICSLVGQGFIDFTQEGKYQGFIDPVSTGNVGDIVATTVGHTSGDKATIVLFLRKKD